MIEKWLEKRRYAEVLSGCNYDMARSIIIKKFKGTVIPTDLVARLDQYVSNPGMDSAIELLKYDSTFVSIFELSKKGGFAEHLFSKGEIK